MSYNIDHVDCLVLDARMLGKDWKRLSAETDKYPEISFFEDQDPDLLEDNIEYPLDTFSWSGEGSGWAYDWLKDEVAPCIHGRIEAIMIWEGGDSVSGFKIVDGVFVEHKVIYYLGEPL